MECKDADSSWDSRQVQGRGVRQRMSSETLPRRSWQLSKSVSDIDENLIFPIIQSTHPTFTSSPIFSFSKCWEIFVSLPKKLFLRFAQFSLCFAHRRCTSSSLEPLSCVSKEMASQQSSTSAQLPRNQFVSALLTDYYQITMVCACLPLSLPSFPSFLIFLHRLGSP